MEEQKNLIVCSVERNIMDSVGYGLTHHPVKTHRKEDGKERKETARESRKVVSSKVEKAEIMGKENVKERKDNVSTKSRNHQKNSGQVDTGNHGLNNLGTQKPTLRVGGTMIGTQQIRILRQQQPKNFSVHLLVICDSNLGYVKHIEFFQHDRLEPSRRTITFGVDTAACKTVVLANHPAARGYLVHKDSLLGCACSIALRDKVYDQGKRILCTSDEIEKPMAIESREVDCRRPLMAVTEMTDMPDCGRLVFFGPQRQGFSFDPRTGQKIELTLAPGGWDLTMKLEPPERANKIMNKAIQEISAKRRAAAIAKDYGAVSDTDGLVRIMGCDLFRRPDISL